VAVTEGLLADGTRDELQAVAAHELAHITRGDAFTLTLVCSLANMFEKLCEALEPEDDDSRGTRSPGSSSGTSRISPAFFYFAVSLSALIMHLLSTLVSRERELLADAAAVEFCRSPDSLARIIYKAQVKNSFIGDFSMTYAPLFIIPPDSRDIPDTLSGRIFNTHPPLMKRLGLLAAMAGKTPEAIIAEVRESEAQRQQARGVIHSFEEIRKRQLELFPSLKRAPHTAAGPGPEPAGLAVPSPPADGTAPAPAGSAVRPATTEVPAPLAAPDGGPAVSGSRIWLLATNLPERWEGPFTTPELLCNPRFSLLSRIKNTQENVEAKAREFAQVRIALHDPAAARPLDPGRRNLCPRCHVPLAETYYEGVPVGFCTSCTGKLVEMATVDRIIARREVAFSDDLLAKARVFWDRVQLNPVGRRKINDALTERIPCPYCGYGMVARPYNYEYFVPVDKCLACSRIWFDADELEILQILIEEHQAA
jgi:Zn-finger nucleic acid-binding protein